MGASVHIIHKIHPSRQHFHGSLRFEKYIDRLGIAYAESIFHKTQEEVSIMQYGGILIRKHSGFVQRLQCPVCIRNPDFGMRSSIFNQKILRQKLDVDDPSAPEFDVGDSLILSERASFSMRFRM